MTLDQITIALLTRPGGVPAERARWPLEQKDRLVADLAPSAVDRTARPMEQDRPVDLADGTLVALADTGGGRRIFTLDAEFQIYRFWGRQRLETIASR